MIDKLTEQGLAIHDQVFDLERLCARQQVMIQRQAALLKQKRYRARAVNAEIRRLEARIRLLEERLSRNS